MNRTKKILIIEDEEKLRSTIQEYLEISDYSTRAVGTGTEALKILAEEGEWPDLILLDLMLPGISSFETLKRIREKSDIPVIILTARSSEDDQLKGFDLVADDYLTKPFLLSVITGGIGILYSVTIKNMYLTYFIMITESTSLIDRTTRSVKQVLFLMIVLFLVLGAFVVRWLSQSIGRPVANAVRVAGKIANKDFSERLEEKTSYQELDELGGSINEMSLQLQSYIQDLEAYNRMLEQDNERRIELEKYRKQFVNNVSHELKTPLAIISSQAELISMIREDGKRQEYCDSVMEETRKMSQMIHSMLQIFAVEQGLEDVPMVPVDLAKAAQETTAEFHGVFEKK